MKSINAAGLEKVMEMTAVISVTVLLVHFYFFCYQLFVHWGLRSSLSDRILHNLASTGFFYPGVKAKLIALGALLLTVMGTEGSQSVTLKFRGPALSILLGLTLYFTGTLVLFSQLPIPLSVYGRGEVYIAITITGYLLVMRGGAQLTRIVRLKLRGDVFNRENETFPQQEKRLESEYSLHFPTTYQFRGRRRHGWINVVNVFRGLLISGLPGSGKTLLVREVISQQIKKQFSMLVYDFKYPDLTLPAYNHYLRFRDHYPVPPAFYILNFEEPKHRCNPLVAESLSDIDDASEMARTILLGLNHEWIGKQGNFWVESPISFLAAVIWYLRKYQDGKYCTLPHVIELVHTPYEELFTLLSAEPEVAILIQPFVSAFRQQAREQLEGQVSGARISLGKLSSPNLYYVLSGNDFSMDIGNPDQPKIVCMASSPRKAHIYGSVISLYLTAFQHLSAGKENRKTSLILEEFPTLYFNGIDRFLAVCRSYLVAITLVIQDASQLTLYYGKHQAQVILNLVGNIISGQLTGESAKMLSERFGKIIQERNSISVSDNPSFSVSSQLDYAVPASTISSLSAGEVAGVVSDSPDQILDRKMFHGKVRHDFKALHQEEAGFKPLPKEKADTDTIMKNYLQIKTDIKELVKAEMEFIERSPVLESLSLKKSAQRNLTQR